MKKNIVSTKNQFEVGGCLIILYFLFWENASQNNWKFENSHILLLFESN